MKFVKCRESMPSYRVGGWGSRTIKNELRTTSGRRVLLSDSSRLRGRQGKSPENPERFEGWPRGVWAGRVPPSEGSTLAVPVFRSVYGRRQRAPGSSASPALSCGAVLIAVTGKPLRRYCCRLLVAPEVVSSAGRSGGARTRVIRDGPRHLGGRAVRFRDACETYARRGYFRSPTHFTLPRLLPECCGAPLWWMLVYFWQPPRLISDCVTSLRGLGPGTGPAPAAAKPNLPQRSREA